MLHWGSGLSSCITWNFKSYQTGHPLMINTLFTPGPAQCVVVQKKEMKIWNYFIDITLGSITVWPEVAAITSNAISSKVNILFADLCCMNTLREVCFSFVFIYWLWSSRSAVWENVRRVHNHCIMKVSVIESFKRLRVKQNRNFQFQALLPSLN